MKREVPHCAQNERPQGVWQWFGICRERGDGRHALHGSKDGVEKLRLRVEPDGLTARQLVRDARVFGHGSQFEDRLMKFETRERVMGMMMVGENANPNPKHHTPEMASLMMRVIQTRASGLECPRAWKPPRGSAANPLAPRGSLGTAVPSRGETVGGGLIAQYQTRLG